MTGQPRLLISPPDVGPAEEEAVLRAVRSGWVAPTGPEVTAFENELAKRCGVAHGVAMSSGTAALHLALLGLGTRPGDAVVVPTMTFVASANAVVYAGAEPVFVDVGPDGNVDPELVREAVETLRREGRQVAAVMTVDLLGRCADYAKLDHLCADLGLPLLEDAAEALGATSATDASGRPAGAFGQAAALSFNGNKIMTTSGGGMLLTRDETLAQQARHLSTQAREPVAHYEHEVVGYNYRLSNVLAALGRAQLSRLDAMLARRREIRERYATFVADVPGVEIFQRDGDEHDNCWLTAIVVDPGTAAADRDTVLVGLESRGVEARPLWKPMHLQPVFAGARMFGDGHSQRLFDHGVTLPSGSVHDDAAIERVCEGLADVLHAGGRVGSG